MTDEMIVDAEEVGTDLVPVAPPGALFRTEDPLEIIQRATEVANALKAVLKEQGLTQNIQGKDHVRVEGWQFLGAMLGVTAICTETEPVDGGYKATVEVRTADGRVIGRADALCTKHEKRGPWKSAEDYARLSMAQTRATSKAFKGPLGFVVSLAGYATTPAEEMAGVASVTEAVTAAKAEAKTIGPTAIKQLNHMLQKFTVSDGDYDKLAMHATSLGCEIDTAADNPWASCTREQGKSLYAYLSQAVATREAKAA